MSQRLLIAGNWKMFKTRSEAQAEVRKLLVLLDDAEEVDVIVCPPFTVLSAVNEVVRGTFLQLGAQNVHWEEQGAYTGEVSTSMLLDCGCRYAIIGHSERRQFFHESDDILNLKLKKVLDTELVPILCVGESLEEREADHVQEVVLGQLERALKGLTAEKASPMIIAYEPVWAIGTSKTATPGIAEEVQSMIRKWLASRFSEGFAAQTRILYGGSVKPENARDLMSQENIDGALVGGASLDAQSFVKIVKACTEQQECAQ